MQMLRADGVAMSGDDWADVNARSLAVRMSAENSATFLLLLNASDGPVEFTVPEGV